MKYSLVPIILFLSLHTLSAQSYEEGMIFYRKGFDKQLQEQERRKNLGLALDVFENIPKEEERVKYVRSYNVNTRIASIHNVLGVKGQERRRYKKTLYKLDHPSIPDVPLILCGLAADQIAMGRLREYALSYLALNKVEEANHKILFEPNSFISANDNGYMGIGTQIDAVLFIEIIHLKFDKDTLQLEFDKALKSIKSNYSNRYSKTNTLFVETSFLSKKIYIFPKDFDNGSNNISFNKEEEVIEHYKQIFLASNFVKELQFHL